MVKTSKAASAADDILSLVDEMQQEKEIKQESVLLQQALDELHETRTIVTTTHDDLISARRATAEATNKLNNASTTITTAIKDAYSKKITFGLSEETKNKLVDSLTQFVTNVEKALDDKEKKYEELLDNRDERIKAKIKECDDEIIEKLRRHREKIRYETDGFYVHGWFFYVWLTCTIFSVILLLAALGEYFTKH